MNYTDKQIRDFCEESLDEIFEKLKIKSTKGYNKVIGRYIDDMNKSGDGGFDYMWAEQIMNKFQFEY